MRQILGLIVLAIPLTACADDACPEPPGSTFGDKGKLQGTWTLVTLEYRGKLAMHGLRRLTITSDKMKMTGQGMGNNDEGTYRLDTSGKLKHIDLTGKDSTTKGIYKLEKTQLIMAFSTGKADRPKGFDAKADIVMTFQKAK
jgi:uncharacterized protein (TIGR03067 family)